MSEPSEEPQIPQISTGLGFQAGSPIAYGRITVGTPIAPPRGIMLAWELKSSGTISRNSNSEGEYLICH